MLTDEEWEKKLKELQEKLDHHFKDETLLKKACTAKSFAMEKRLREEEHQEALSVLGDKVQDVVVLTRVIVYGISQKGKLTDFAQFYAKEETQQRIAFIFHLEKYIRWGKGDEKGEIWLRSPVVLSTCWEALLGAIYLDGGMDASEKVFWHLCESIKKSQEKIR